MPQLSCVVGRHGALRHGDLITIQVSGAAGVTAGEQVCETGSHGWWAQAVFRINCDVKRFTVLKIKGAEEKRTQGEGSVTSIFTVDITSV
jgi:hypothetical protein